nr:hypothetical protein [uncultured Lacibacter sp.]
MKVLILLAIVCAPVLSFTTLSKQEKGYYSILVVDGSKNGTGYASKVIYYPGYASCKRSSGSDFSKAAARGYADYLKANYNSAFPYAQTNDIRTIETRQHSTSELLLTKEQADQRLTQWAAEQKDKGYQVVYTNFHFNCNNL